MYDLNDKPAAVSDGIPLFYLGDDPAFKPLARRVGAVHRFASVPIPSAMLESSNPYSLRRIAEEFAKTIRQKRPRGPYILGGWCAYGVLALETAQILREQAQDVALLVLLETINPERLRRQGRLVQTLAKLQSKLSLFGFEYKYLRSLGENHAKAYFAEGIARSLKDPHSGLGPTRNTDRERRITPLEILYTAVGNYLPRPYDSPVLLIRTRRAVFGVRGDRDLGWGKTLGKLEICETDGNHYTMYIQPNVEGLVQKVSDCLKTAEQRWQQQGA